MTDKMSMIVETDISPLFIRVDHVAADMPPSYAVKHMCRLATRIGIKVHCEINGIEVSIFPNTNEEIMMGRYDKAASKNAKWVSCNASPISLRD